MSAHTDSVLSVNTSVRVVIYKPSEPLQVPPKTNTGQSSVGKLIKKTGTMEINFFLP